MYNDPGILTQKHIAHFSDKILKMYLEKYLDSGI